MDPVIVCEGGTFNKTCPNGTRFHLEDAIYGRTDNTMCSLNNGSSCVAKGTLITSRGICSPEEQSCTIWASNYIFGDPCPGIHKYLNITYECKDKNGNCLFLQ